jgi:oligopeptide/dipeptide ABC transporter ATP-binding protein
VLLMMMVDVQGWLPFIIFALAVMYLCRIVELAESETLLDNQMHPYTKALIMAVPVPDPRASKSRATISGEPPNPFNPPSGCAFHARSPHADAKCLSQPPNFRPFCDNHIDACHHAKALPQRPDHNQSQIKGLPPCRPVFSARRAGSTAAICTPIRPGPMACWTPQRSAAATAPKATTLSP